MSETYQDNWINIGEAVGYVDVTKDTVQRAG